MSRTADGPLRGPLRPWVVIALMALVGLNLRAPLGALPPLIDRVGADLSIGKATQGLQLSLMVALIGLSAPLGHRASARLRTQPRMTAALVVLAAGGLLRLAADDLGLLLASSLLTGVGMGAAGVLVPGLVARHVPGRVGLATGAFAVGMGFGVALAAAVTPPAVDLLSGWRPALALWGVVAAATGLLWAVVVPTRSDGVDLDEKVPHALPWGSGVAWLVVCFCTAAMAAGFTGTTWLSALLLEHGLSEERSAAYYVLFQLTGVVSMLGLPAVTDRIADLRGLMGAALSAQAVAAMLLLSAPTSAAPVAAVLLGLGMGGGTSLTQVLVTRVTTTLADAGRLNALVMLLAYPLSAIAPALFGLAHDVTATFALGCAVATVVAFLGLVAVVPLRPGRTLSTAPEPAEQRS